MSAGSILEALYDKLKADATVSALVSEAGRVKVFIDQAEQGVKPEYVVIQRVSSPGVRHLLGKSDLEETHFDLLCVGSSRAKRRTLAEAVMTAVEDQDGLWDTIWVYACARVNTEDEYVPYEDGSDEGLFVTRQEVAVWNYK